MAELLQPFKKYDEGDEEIWKLIKYSKKLRDTRLILLLGIINYNQWEMPKNKLKWLKKQNVKYNQASDIPLL